MLYPDPPPRAFQLPPGCGRDLPLQKPELTCYQLDPHVPVAVAWIRDHCDEIPDPVGPYSSWPAAMSAYQQELGLRQADHLGLLPLTQCGRLRSNQSGRFTSKQRGL